MDPRTIDLSDPKWLPGNKTTVRGVRAAVSSDNAVVTYTMLDVLRDGGNAVDAAIAGSLLQCVIEPFMTNFTGTVTGIFYDAEMNTFAQLDSTGTIPFDLPPHMPVPPGMGEYSDLPSRSCIPGFMPGMKELYETRASLPWERLIREALWWAENGHHVSDHESSIYNKTQRFITYFPEGRRFFMPDGHMPVVGSIFKNDDMTRTVRRIAADGPDYMITGQWADAFVKRANEMGWSITKAHMTQTPPVWREPVRFPVAGHEVVSLAPPMQQGVFLAMVLDILEKINISSYEPYGAEHLFIMSHALEIALDFCGFFNDPKIAGDTRPLMDPVFHESLAGLIRGLLPKVDLTSHMKFTKGNLVQYDYSGYGCNIPEAPLGDDTTSKQPSGSCELSVVDQFGNWVQMMNTLQTGGIPGMVVDGVPMVGSHCVPNQPKMPMAYYHTEGARVRSCMGNTMLLKDGKPVFSLGSPGNCHCTVPQVLCNYIFFGMDPYEAISMPRMLQRMPGQVLLMEDRVKPGTVDELMKLGMELRVSLPWDMHMGSFQSCYIDASSKELCATVDPRRCGVADGII